MPLTVEDTNSKTALLLAVSLSMDNCTFLWSFSILKESLQKHTLHFELNLSSHKIFHPNKSLLSQLLILQIKCPRLTEPTLKATLTTLLVAATPASRVLTTTPTPTEATIIAMTTAPLTTPPPAEAPLTLLLPAVPPAVAVAESNQAAVACS